MTSQDICYSPRPARDYLPHDCTHPIVCQFAKDQQIWNFLWLLQPQLDECLTLDKNDWTLWSDITQKLDLDLIANAKATLTADDTGAPVRQISLRSLLKLPPDRFLTMLLQRDRAEMPLFQNFPEALATVKARVALAAGHHVEEKASAAVTAVENNVVRVDFRRKAG